jgi:transposase
MRNGDIQSVIKEKYQALLPLLDEHSKRRWAAVEAKAIGHGGQTLVSKATGLSRHTIYAGLRELEQSEEIQEQSIRRKGGGRKKLCDVDLLILTDLDELVEPDSRGDPQSPLRWTCKSTRGLAEELQSKGHKIGYRKVAALLQELGYSLQSLRKTREGGFSTDRNLQFAYINNKIKEFQGNGQPVISVDAKKKELIGDFQNKGREWQPKGKPEKVRVYDFIDKELGKANPYGVYDLVANEGWVSVGTDHDTAEFALESIRRWWIKMGQQRYPNATELLIMADGGGSNGSRNRLWKMKLQEFANEMKLRISVCHFPPGTSKWNKIEHRMFSYISMNWRGRPLINLETVVNLIANTT